MHATKRIASSLLVGFNYQQTKFPTHAIDNDPLPRELVEIGYEHIPNLIIVCIFFDGRRAEEMGEPLGTSLNN